MSHLDLGKARFFFHRVPKQGDKHGLLADLVPVKCHLALHNRFKGMGKDMSAEVKDRLSG